MECLAKNKVCLSSDFHRIAQ